MPAPRARALYPRRNVAPSWGEIAALRVGRFYPLRATVDVMESATEVDREVRFVAPKNGKTRSIRIPRALVDRLVPLVAGKGPEAFVFAKANGQPLRHSQFYVRVFRPAVAAAGLPASLRFHDLRHTCAALLTAQGAHPRAIMERLGHSSINVTMDAYGHLLPSIDESLATGLDEVLRAAVARETGHRRGTVAALRTSHRDLPAGSVEAGSGIEPLYEVLQTSA